MDRLYPAKRSSTRGRVFRQRAVQALGRARSAHCAVDQDFFRGHPASIDLLVIVFILLVHGPVERRPAKQAPRAGVAENLRMELRIGSAFCRTATGPAATDNSAPNLTLS